MGVHVVGKVLEVEAVALTTIEDVLYTLQKRCRHDRMNDRLFSNDALQLVLGLHGKGGDAAYFLMCMRGLVV